MRAVGMARKVDQLGRIVVPAEMRRMFRIEEGDLVEIYVEEDHLALAKVEQRCVFCGAQNELRAFKEKLVCAACVQDLGG